MLLTERRVERRLGGVSGRERVATTIRVFANGMLLGSVLLNEDNRVLRRTPDVPREVVLKVLVQFTRCEEVDGHVTSRHGEVYRWRVRGEREG
jgi:hypothetical protein